MANKSYPTTLPKLPAPNRAEEMLFEQIQIQQYQLMSERIRVNFSLSDEEKQRLRKSLSWKIETLKERVKN